MESEYILASASTNENEQTRATDTIEEIRDKVNNHNVKYFVLKDKKYEPVKITDNEFPVPTQLLKNGLTRRNAIVVEFVNNPGIANFVKPLDLFVKRTTENSVALGGGGGGKAKPK
jgi:hypothetical protein